MPTKGSPNRAEARGLTAEAGLSLIRASVSRMIDLPLTMSCPPALVLSLPFRWVWLRPVLLLGEEGPSEGWVRDQAFDIAAANGGLDGWTSGGAVGEADDFGYCA
jgi:hypothetical protein